MTDHTAPELEEADLGNGITGYYQLDEDSGYLILRRLVIDNPSSTLMRTVRMRDIERRPGLPPNHIAPRQAGESSPEFYARIAREYARLVAEGHRRPTLTIAERLGMPVSTVACWMSRARARGLYPRGNAP